jgi:hypothetical protein
VNNKKRSRFHFLPCLVASSATREFCVHEALNEVYLENLFTDGCNFSR